MSIELLLGILNDLAHRSCQIIVAPHRNPVLENCYTFCLVYGYFILLLPLAAQLRLILLRQISKYLITMEELALNMGPLGLQSTALTPVLWELYLFHLTDSFQHIRNLDQTG